MSEKTYFDFDFDFETCFIYIVYGTKNRHINKI